MKTYYEQLGVGDAARPEDIKRAFRREIARYHPDKVQHLGPEFLEIATARAAELTQAYRVLIDPEARREYDSALGRAGMIDSGGPAAKPDAAGFHRATGRQPSVAAEEQESPRAGCRLEQARAATADVVRRAIISRLRDAVTSLAGYSEPLGLAGFDAAYRVSPRRPLLGNRGRSLLLLARIVPRVDGASVEDAWLAAAKSGTFEAAICLILLGMGVASAAELAAAIERRLRKARKGRPIVVPVDVRTWEALFPPDVPAIARRVVERLRSGA